jgi:hypothetical protein
MSNPKKYYGHYETRVRDHRDNSTIKVFIPPEIEEIRDRLAAIEKTLALLIEKQS